MQSLDRVPNAASRLARSTCALVVPCILLATCWETTPPVQAPTIGSFTASPKTITAGQSSLLTWSGITNATTCAIDNGVGAVSCSSASNSVSPTSTTTYTLTATGAGGSVAATSTANVTVNAAGPTLTGITPNTGVQGTTVAVTLVGTNFVAGATTVAFDGTGINVNNVTVTSSTSLTASFVTAATATPGPFVMTITTPEGAVRVPAFTVIYDSVTSVRITPSSATLILGTKKGASQQLAATISVLSGQANPTRNVTWSTSDSTKVSISPSGLITAVGNGTATVVARSEGKTSSASAQAGDTFMTPVPSALSQTNSSARQVIPVLEIRLLPSADGVWLDSTMAPTFGSFGALTLDQARMVIDSLDVHVKYSLEEGSRYHGYGNTNSPNVAYTVARILTIYKLPPLLKSGSASVPDIDGSLIPSIDYTQLFTVDSILPLINQMGIKEVWMTFAYWDTSFPVYQQNPSVFDKSTRYRVAESAMSSPQGECVSNSYFQDCQILPRADHTYLLYGDYFRRGWSCSVHNRGHQFERMFDAVDRDTLFWRRFAGMHADGSMGIGRAGATHFAPNSNVPYDYWNKTIVQSDIESWLPQGGPTTGVNVDTWGSVPYRYADLDNCGGTWLTFWMQAFPTYGSGISLSGRPLEDWWKLYANWDAWRSQGRSLVTSSSPAAFQVPAMSSSPRPVRGTVISAAVDYPAPLSAARKP